jgi:8-oxo-dGTP pyrophosphatase MutT (NUDIX family)
VLPRQSRAAAAASLPGPDRLEDARGVAAHDARGLAAQSFGGRLLRIEDATAIEVRGNVQSAVLVTLTERDGELLTVFTRRSDDLRRHAGEISFPGGRLDPEDTSLVHTALREAEEEVGLDPAEVTVLGALQPTPTIATGYAIYPFVAAIANDLTWQSSPAEVAELIELPLSAVRDGYGRRRLVRRGLPIRTDTYVVGDHLIWGATARILGDLFDRIAL